MNKNFLKVLTGEQIKNYRQKIFWKC